MWYKSNRKKKKAYGTTDRPFWTLFIWGSTKFFSPWLFLIRDFFNAWDIWRNQMEKKKKDFLLLLFFCFLQTKIVISGMNFARSSRVAIFFAWGQLHAVKGCLGSTKRWYLLGVVLFCLGKNILILFLIGCRFWIFMGLYKTINKFTVRI